MSVRACSRRLVVLCCLAVGIALAVFSSAAFAADPVSFSGVVTRDLDGSPIQGVTVSVLREIDGTWTEVTWVPTNAAGGWSVTGQPEGRYTFEFRNRYDRTEADEYYHDAYVPERAQAVEAAAGQSYTISEGLAEGGVLTGKLIDGLTGEPHHFVRSYAWRFEPSTGTWSQYTSSSITYEGGFYRLTRLPAGTYRVELRTSDYPPIRNAFHPEALRLEDARDIVVLAGLTTTADAIGYPVEQVKGVITSAFSGKSLYDVQVRLWSRDGAGEWQVVRTATQPNHVDYLLYDLAPGTYRLTAHDTRGRYHDWAYGGARDVTSGIDLVISRGERRAVDIAMEPRFGTVRGTVRDAKTGEPLPGAVVAIAVHELELGAGSVTPSTTLVTDADGAYVFRYEPAFLSFAVSAADHSPQGTGQSWSQRATLSADSSQTVDFALLPYSRFAIKTIDVISRRPISGITVTYSSPYTGVNGVAISGPDGVARTPLIPASHDGWSGDTYYWFELSDPMNGYAPFTFYEGTRILAGESVEVTAALQPTGGSQSIEGLDRFRTAIAASKAAFPDGSADSVVLCTGYNFPDALGGASLAGATNGPLLLSATDRLTGAVAAEIRRVGAKRAYIIGSESAVPAGVASGLADLLGGPQYVTRLGGAGRYDTAKLVASATVDAIGSGAAAYDGTVFIATGRNFPDALAASPIAAAKRWPILLADGDTLPKPTLEALELVGAKRAILLGSDKAVGAGVESALRRRLGSENVSRLEGADRYRTAIEIAKFGVNQGLTWDGVAFATGQDYPDALAGGVMQGRFKSVVLLTPSTSLDPSLRMLLAQRRADILRFRFLGSTTALSQDVRNAIVTVVRHGS